MDDYEPPWTGFGARTTPVAEDAALLAEIAESVDEHGIATLLALIPGGRCERHLPQQVLLAFGQRGTPAAIAAIGNYEEWAAARETRLRPSWAVDRHSPHRWLVRDPDGRWWGVHSWTRWRQISLWLSWSSDGARWSPAWHVGNEAVANDLWQMLATHGAGALAELDLARTDAEVMARLHRWIDRVDAGDSDRMRELRLPRIEVLCRQPSEREAAIAQAVWCTMVATRDDDDPLLVQRDNILGQVALRGALGPRVVRRRLVNRWTNLSLTHVGRDQRTVVERELVDHTGPLAACGTKVTVELKHGRWVVTEAKHTWIS